MKIGVQLFTVRKQAQKDLYKCLEMLKNIDIKYIEAARIEFNLDTGEIFQKAKESFGTEVVATQIKFHTLKDDFANVLAFHKRTNCKNAIISVLPTENIIGSDLQLLEFCKKANSLAKQYKDEGIQLCYHHHDFEFTKRQNGVQFDILKENLDDNVKFVIDTYWATKGGYAADTLIKTLSGKVQGVHLRDYALTLGFSRKPKDFAVGDGVIDFQSVINTCQEMNVEYGAIEQKTKKPFEELQKSVGYIKELGFDDMLL